VAVKLPPKNLSKNGAKEGTSERRPLNRVGAIKNSKVIVGKKIIDEIFTGKVRVTKKKVHIPKREEDLSARGPKEGARRSTG